MTNYTFLSGVNPETDGRLSGHNNLCAVLDALKYKYDVVVGVWNGEPELSVKVFNLAEADGLFLLRQFGQGSMLQVEGGKADLILNDGTHAKHFNRSQTTRDWLKVAGLSSYTILPDETYIYFYEGR